MRGADSLMTRILVMVPWPAPPADPRGPWFSRCAYSFMKLHCSQVWLAGHTGWLCDGQGPCCKAPDVVLTLTSRFRVRSGLEAHQAPPAHDTRTRVAAGFS